MTRTIEETPVASAAPSTAGTAVTYSDEVAGTVEDLYTDTSALASNVAYQRAVAREPALRYNIVYFDFNRADIHPESSALIRRHAAYLQQKPEVFVMLEGHADKRGSEGYNLALGDRRAQAVRAILTSNGVSDGRLTAISFGEEKPAVFGDDETAFNRNRRVEIIYQ